MSHGLDHSSLVRNLLGYSFCDGALLKQALTHSSFTSQAKEETWDSSLAWERQETKRTAHNERLEFLGDAVLGLLIAEKLMKRYPAKREGTLSLWRSFLVNQKTLSQIGKQLNLGSFMFLGKSERMRPGTVTESVIASGVEALLGAIYLDGGIEEASKVVEKLYEGWWERLESDSTDIEGEASLGDYKTLLQQKLQARYHQVPTYQLISAVGPDHQKVFRVVVKLEDRVLGEASGPSKKEAERAAAYAGLQCLGEWKESM